MSKAEVYFFGQIVGATEFTEGVDGIFVEVFLSMEKIGNLYQVIKHIKHKVDMLMMMILYVLHIHLIYIFQQQVI